MPRILLSAAVAALVAVAAPTPASGVTYDKLAYLTFSAPVQIPGATLSAGTYRFHLTNPETSRNVLQVLSKDGSIVYSMFHTIPDRRMSLTEDPIVTFRETPAGVAPAVKSIFYGDEYRGYEFVYPDGGPNTIAEVASQPEITYTPYPAPPAPAAVFEPELKPAEPGAEPVVEQPAEPLAAPEPAQLPRTASPVPLVALGGLTSLLVAFGLGLLRRRTA
jgi:hypothetical protein